MELLPLVLLKQDDPKIHPSLASSGSGSPFPAMGYTMPYKNKRLSTRTPHRSPNPMFPALPK